MPFTGCIVDFSTPNSPVNSRGRRNVWTDYEIPQSDLDTFVSDYNRIPFARFQKNLLRLDIASPGDLSIYSANISKVYNNWANIGRALAKTDADLFLDVESYGPNAWQYTYWNGQGWPAFATALVDMQAFGKACGDNLLPHMSGKTVVLIFGYELTYDRDGVTESSEYGMYPAWLDGFLESAANHPEVRLVFGGENSYLWRKGFQSPTSTTTINWYRDGVRDETFPHTPIPGYALTKMGRMFAVWADYLNGDYFNEETLARALRLADDYSTDGIWLYSQDLNFTQSVDNPPQWMIKVFEDFVDELRYRDREQAEPARQVAMVVPAASLATYNGYMTSIGYGNSFNTSLSGGSHFLAVVPLTVNGYYHFRGYILASGAGHAISYIGTDGQGSVKSFVEAQGLTL